ncbi:sugar phosphate isomerase/epimerase [Candidatus Woesearchaeota archaeon]|nr:sugar phosphate isomerase/epimerase [Candidatus Woesearchaeota archaeon]
MRLGINTGFALNRFPRPEQWMQVIGEELGLSHVQLTADLLNPSLGEEITSDLVRRVKQCQAQYDVHIDSVMTGAFTRVNHFAHPDEAQRRYWLNWFHKLGDIAVELGATDLSSHFGIMCYEDLHKRPDQRLYETVQMWKELAKYGQKIGLKTLSWEPMSIRREFGETLEETAKIQKMLDGSAIPVVLCLDVDHGDLTSQNPNDYNYRKWLERFADQSPFIHIKQSLQDKGGHYPFIDEYNRQGNVTPQEVLSILRQRGADDVTLLLELSFREREPTDSLVLQHLKESAAYWKKGIEDYSKTA